MRKLVVISALKKLMNECLDSSTNFVTGGKVMQRNMIKKVILILY